jgi:hypothetical protein
VSATLALMPKDNGEAGAGSLLVWNGTGRPVGELDRMRELLRAGSAGEADAGLLGLEAGRHLEAADTAPFLGAAALALTGMRKGPIPLDFAHSRAGLKRATRRTRRIVWAAILAATAVVAAGALADQWSKEKREVAELRTRLGRMRGEIGAAQTVVDEVTLARGWTDRRPRFLDPLRELTLALPVDAPIWLSSLAIREDMRAVISGKSTGERSVLELLDRLRGNAAFDDVELLYMRKASTRGSEVAFSMALSFKRGN